MDPQIVLIGVAVFVLSALIIYLISVFGFKEKSYEEAIAEQKRRLEEEKEKARTEKKAEKEKKRYRKGKEKPKEKEKSAQVSEPELKEHKMVNLEIDPEIIEPLDSSPERKHKTKKHEKLKPILSNKDEKPVIAKHTQEVIHHKLPKDEVELKHEHDKEKKSPSKTLKMEKEHRIRDTVAAVEEQIIVEKQVKVQSAPLQHVQSEDRKSTKGEGNSQLFTSVRTASLSDKEVQTLIDILLDKQNSGASATMEWNKKIQKGDPVFLLRKQLEEKERALQEEQQLAMSANNKCKKLEMKVSEDKSHYSNMEKQYQEKLTSQNQEMQALHSRMQNAHDQHMIESSNLQARLQQLQQQVGDGGRIHKLLEENKMLKENLERTKVEAIPPAEFNSLRQKVSIMENELSNNVMKLTASEKSRKNLESKITKYDEELKKYKTTEKEGETMWSKRVDEIGQQLRKAEAEKATVTNSLQAAEKECMSVKNRLKELEKTLSGTDSNSKELEEKLKGSEKQLSTVKTSLKNVEKRLTDTEKQRDELKDQLEVLRKENQALSTEVKTARERHVGEGQERGKTVGAPNGDINAEKTEKDSISVTEHEKLKSAVESSKTEVISLQKEVDTYKMDIKRAEAEIQNYQLEVTNVREQLELQKKKNNELREKNWKAMDALEKAEKSSSDKVKIAVKSSKEDGAKLVSEMEKNYETILKRLFPEVKVSEKSSHKEWVSNFEKEASKYVTDLSVKVKESNTSSESRVQELQSKSVQLESILKEQQTLNTKLQSQLQESQKHASQLESKQKEVLSSNQHLQSQVDTLKKSSHSSAESETKIKELQNSNTKLQSQLSDLQSQLNDSKNQISSMSGASDSRVHELEENNSKLQSQLDEYRNVLATTETKLQQLENSVEGEEKKWQEKLQSAQLNLEQARQESVSLKEELQKMRGSSEALTELDFAYRCVEKSLVEITDEMNDKVSSLETQLKIAEERTVELEKEIVEKTETISTMQLKVISTEKSTGDIDELLRQIAELKKNIEEEKKKSKDLAFTNVKLNGIIKTGHDALTQEQEMVQKLKEQLQDKNKGSEQPVQGIEELKVKLAETEKQLEREMTNNKQLTQRLTASQANDVGTSV